MTSSYNGWSLPFSSTQCAAVTIQRSLIIDPPQKWLLNPPWNLLRSDTCRELRKTYHNRGFTRSFTVFIIKFYGTCHGKSCSRAFMPPTIRFVIIPPYLLRPQVPYKEIYHIFRYIHCTYTHSHYITTQYIYRNLSHPPPGITDLTFFLFSIFPFSSFFSSFFVNVFSTFLLDFLMRKRKSLSNKVPSVFCTVGAAVLSYKIGTCWN